MEQFSLAWQPPLIKHLAKTLYCGCLYPDHTSICPTCSCLVDDPAYAVRDRALPQWRIRLPRVPLDHPSLNYPLGRVQEPKPYRLPGQQYAWFGLHRPRDECRRSTPQGRQRERPRPPRGFLPGARRKMPPGQGCATRPCACLRRQRHEYPQSPRWGGDQKQCVFGKPGARFQRNRRTSSPKPLAILIPTGSIQAPCLSIYPLY